MKRFRLFSAFLVLFSAISFTACDTEPVDPELVNNPQNPGPNNPGPGDEDAVFKVDFSGQTYTATSTQAVIGNGLITIGGFRGTNGESVAFVLDGTTTGTYDEEALISYDPGNASEFTYSNFNLSTGETSGSVIITTIDTENHTISGTFSFTGWWGDEDAGLAPIVFTNGVFENIPYTGNPGTNPIGEDEFVATVDGTFINYANDLIVAVAGAGEEETLSLNAVHDTHKIVLYLDTDTATGTYNLTSDMMVLPRAKYYDEATDTDYNIDNGQIIITSNNGTNMVGTFSFAVKNDAGETIHTVSGGGFDVNYAD